MSFLLVLPILICGFIYCTYNLYDKTLIAKYEGQSLYLHIAMRSIALDVVVDRRTLSTGMCELRIPGAG